MKFKSITLALWGLFFLFALGSPEAFADRYWKADDGTYLRIDHRANIYHNLWLLFPQIDPATIPSNVVWTWHATGNITGHWVGHVPAAPPGPSPAELARQAELERLRQAELERQRAELARQTEIKRQLELGRTSELAHNLKAAQAASNVLAEAKTREAEIDAVRDEKFKQLKSARAERIARAKACAEAFCALNPPAGAVDAIDSAENLSETVRRPDNEVNSEDLANQLQQRRDRSSSTKDEHQCFVGGTLVLTPDKDIPLKPIESLVAGDEVWSCNTNESQCAIRTIIRTSVTFTKHLVSVHLTNQNGKSELIQTTRNHPFYLEGHKEVTLAKDLHQGDFLWAHQDRTEVSHIEFVKKDEPLPVYNFQVEAQEGNNNYFVGEHLVLVHNCNMGRTTTAVAQVSGPVCTGTATLCVAGLAATGATGIAAVGTGGVAVVALPAIGEATATACTLAVVSCGVTGVAAGIHNVFSTGGDDSAGAEAPSRPNQMQQEVRRGQAPKEVERVDKPHVPGQEPHVHYKDGTSSSQSGQVHDAHKGIPNPSKATVEWLKEHGWTPPKQ